MRLLLTTFLLSVSGSASLAQDAGGVFNMGQLTGTSGQDHVTQSERARAAEADDDDASARSSRTAANCAKVPALRQRYGADDPRILTVTRLCRKLGYSVR